jgi:nucleotide-binding universal stress UspA family protein
VRDTDRPPLLCFDGTEPAAGAIRAAARLLRPQRAVVATVWHPTDRFGRSSDECGAARRAGAAAELDEAGALRAGAVASEGCAIAQEVGIAAEPRPIAGDDVAAALVALGGEIDASVLVVGGRPAAARDPRLRASVGRAVAHGADRPVLVTHGAATSGLALLAYDGSDASREAITASAALLEGGPALVVHVWLAPSHVLLWNSLIKGPGPLAEPAEMLDEASAEAAHRLAAEGADRARAAGFDAKPVAVPVVRGTWRTILRVARERHARVIVAGSHGWSPLDVALGTVADRITTHADRPVLMVPGRPQADDGST